MSLPIHPLTPTTDTAVVGAVRSAFANSPYRELQRMKIQIGQESIRLSGSVSCFYLKQLAQEITRKAVPNLRIENELIVSED